MLALFLFAPSLASQLPLEKISYDVQITGPVADVSIHQVFRNTSDTFIEATYTFPLDADAAVDQMSIRIDNRTIVAQIETRDEARAAYEQAKANGQVAALTEQERPNVFTQSVAQIPPGAQVVVDLHVVQPVEWDRDHYEMVLPLVVGPRFSPTGTPDIARITPAVSSKPTGLLVDIDVDLYGAPLTSLTSPTHAFEHHGGGDITTVSAHGLTPTRDFVLRWSPASGEPVAQAIRQGKHLLVQVVPPMGDSVAPAGGREIIWVVDTSGSMAGEPLDLCKQAMNAAFDTMDPSDSFMVMNFASSVGQFSPEPLAATLENIERGRQFVAGYRGRGGTHMRAGIQAALDLPRDPNRQRYVVFMTDGYIGNETEILALLEDRVGPTRLMSFGIGSSVNRYLLEEMAKAGGGTATVVTLDESPESAVTRLLDMISRPLMRDLEIDLGAMELRESYPGALGHLFSGRPLEQFGLVSGDADEVTVRGMLGGKPWSKTIPVVWADPGDTAIGATWARQKIGSLERQQRWGEIPDIKEAITNTALEYRLLSRYTSFVAIETIVRNPEGPLDHVDQPVDLPDGVSFETAVSRRYTPPGDPLLTVETPEDATAVIALFPWETAHLRWDAVEARWFHRFLVPRDVPEGPMEVPVLVLFEDGSVEERTEWMYIDATAPELDVEVLLDGDRTIVRVHANEPFRSVQVQPRNRPGLRIRRDLDLDDEVRTHEFILRGSWTEVEVVAKDRAMNTVVQHASTQP